MIPSCNMCPVKKETEREVYNRLQKVTRCKNCDHKPRKKVTTCESGHTVCDLCYVELATCTVCDGEFFDRYHVFYMKAMAALRDKKNFLEKLYDLIECPVCYEDLTCPSWTCWNGHMTCGRCYFYTSTCPICREEFVNLYNSDINAMLSLLESPIECINRIFGCPHTDKYHRLKDHEEICKFKQYDCLIGTCQFSGTLSKLPHHITHTHSKQVYKPDSTHSVDFDIYREESIVMITSNSDNYWLKTKLDSDDVKISLAFMGFKPTIPKALLMVRSSTYAIPVTTIGALNSSDFASTLTISTDSRFIGKKLRCSLTLNSKKSNWLVNTMFLAALAANLTFAIIILDKNMQ